MAASRGAMRALRAVAVASARSVRTPALAQFRSTPRFAAAQPVLRRGVCSVAPAGDVSKGLLVETYKQVGEEARQVMLDTELRMRKEVDEKVDVGADIDLCASMYGHMMAGYMAEFLPTRPDAVVNQIRDKIFTEKGISVEQANAAFEKYKEDHEVQLTMTTMYQHQLDQSLIKPDFTIEKYCEATEDLKNEVVKWVTKIHQNLDEKSGAYMTQNMKMQREQERMMVPSIAIFASQYIILRKWGLSHQEKLISDLLYSVWPQAQQANAQMHQAMNDAHLASYTPDQEVIQKMTEMSQAAMGQ